MVKDTDLQLLTDTQLEIMNFVWKNGSATVADVWKEMSTTREVARNTVQTMMVRLEDKGFLRHRMQGKSFVYLPAKKRTTTLRRMLRALIKTAFAGSTAGLITTLLEQEQLSDAETKRIRHLLDQQSNQDKSEDEK